MNIFLPLIFSIISVIVPFYSYDNLTEQLTKETDNNSTASYTISSLEDEVEPCLFTQLDLLLSETTGTNVKAVLTNSFTLFLSTVAVDLWLYSSTEKTSDINKMTLEGKNSSADLNMGESLSVIASTHGEDRYWVGYAVYYKSGANQTYQTDTSFFYADGTYNPAL